MHLTPNQRMAVIAIYDSIPCHRSINRAKMTSQIALQQNIVISDRCVKDIISKWRRTSIYLKLVIF